MAQLQDTGVGTAPVGAEEVVTPFQDPIRPVADTTATTIANVVGLVEEGVSQKEKVELDKKFKDIKKLRTAVDQGRISYTDARVRAAAAVKAAKNAMPWRADEFTKEAASFFGAYGEGWGVLNKDDAEKSAASFQQKLELAQAKAVQAHYGQPFATISPAKHVDFAVQTQLDNEQAQAKRNRDMGVVTKDNVMDIGDQFFRAEMTKSTAKMNNILNATRFNGKSVLEMRNTMSPKAIMESLGRNDQAREEVVNNIVEMLSQEKRSLGVAYDKFITEEGTKGGFYVGADQYEPRKKALLSGFDVLIKDIETTTDSKALFRYIANQELSNKGALGSAKANNIVYHMARESGMITDDVMTKWLLDPQNASINPTVRGILEDAFTNIQIEDFTRWWDKVQALPQSFPALAETNPRMANIAFLKVKAGMPKLMVEGWDKDGRTKDKQQEFFVMASGIYLHKTSPTQPSTVKQMEEVLFNPQYQKMLAELPKDKQAQIMVPIRQKLVNIIYNEATGTGVVQRINQSVKDMVNKDVIWEVDKDGEITASAQLRGVGATSEEFQKDITKTLFGDNLDRLNDYVNMFNAVMPESFSKDDFANKLVDALIESNPSTKRKTNNE